MHILVLGAAGMVGRKLTERLVRDGRLGGKRHQAADAARCRRAGQARPPGFPVETLAGDFAAPGAADKLVGERPDLIFHLAAIVSGEAEADFDKGYRINLDGTRILFEAIRLERRAATSRGWSSPRRSRCSARRSPTRSATSSSTTPLTSYGTQKAIGELLLNDYSRRGFVDGIGIRLPTICIRPGKPNMAASGFFSNILREPLVGQEAVLPVRRTCATGSPSRAPRSASCCMPRPWTRAAAGRAPQPHHARPLGHRRREIEALRRVAGDKAVALIRREPDRSSWASSPAGRAISTPSARAARLQAEMSFDDIIRVHIEDELGGKIGG